METDSASRMAGTGMCELTSMCDGVWDMLMAYVWVPGLAQLSCTSTNVRQRMAGTQINLRSAPHSVRRHALAVLNQSRVHRPSRRMHTSVMSPTFVITPETIASLTSYWDVVGLSFTTCTRLPYRVSCKLLYATIDMSYTNTTTIPPAFFSVMPSVTTLKLVNGSRIRWYDDIRWCSNLRHLDMKAHSSLVKIMSNIPASTTRPRRRNGRILGRGTGRAGDGKWKHLRSIDLSSCMSLIDIGHLGGCGELRRVDLRMCMRLPYIECARSWTRLTTLNLSWCTSLTDFSPLSDLRELRSLSLFGTNIESLDVLTPCHQLRDLNIAKCTALESLHGLGLQHSCLHDLDASSCTALSDVSQLADMHALITLVMLQCRGITGLPDMRHCPGLRCCRLDGCSGLVSIHSLELCRGLRVVSVEECTLLSRGDDVRHLPRIKTFRANGTRLRQSYACRGPSPYPNHGTELKKKRIISRQVLN